MREPEQVEAPASLSGGRQPPESEASAAVASSGGLRPPLRKKRGRLRFALAASLAVATCTLAYLFIPPVQDFAQTVIRIATNKGVLEIETDDEDIEITSQCGRLHPQQGTGRVCNERPIRPLPQDRDQGITAVTTGTRLREETDLLLLAGTSLGFPLP